MTPILVKGQRVILPGYTKTVKTSYGSTEKVVASREGVFEKLAESPIRCGAPAVIVRDVKPMEPILAVEGQVMFDGADVGIPVNDERLGRLANMLDCAFEQMQSLIECVKSVKGNKANSYEEVAEARALLAHAHKFGFGGLAIREEYQKQPEEE